MPNTPQVTEQETKATKGGSPKVDTTNSKQTELKTIGLKNQSLQPHKRSKHRDRGHRQRHYLSIHSLGSIRHSYNKQ
jgi:hypothetical protein